MIADRSLPTDEQSTAFAFPGPRALDISLEREAEQAWVVPVPPLEFLEFLEPDAVCSQIN
jgi:hypothetical protein